MTFEHRKLAGGIFHRDIDGDSCVFEEIIGDRPIYTAWRGTWEEREKSARTPPAASIEKAVEFMKHRRFICVKCGKVRRKIVRTVWDDECKNGGKHEWEPAVRRRKKQEGRKINIWFADTQLDEIEEIAFETGNDRASTIRELVALGIKSRRKLDSEE